MRSKIIQQCLYTLKRQSFGIYLSKLSIILSVISISALFSPSVSFCQNEYIYLPSFDLNEFRSRLSESIPRELFSNPNDKLMIEDNKIYHGTSIVSAESILRTKKVVIQSFGNSPIHTANVRGRGWYFSGRYYDASAFALMKENNGGTLIEVKIRPGSKILIWNRAFRHPYIQELLARFDESDRPTSPQRTLDFLATQGVDMVVNGATEIIVINQAAIELPNSIFDLSKLFEDKIKTTGSYSLNQSFKVLLRNLELKGFGTNKKSTIHCLEVYSNGLTL